MTVSLEALGRAADQTRLNEARARQWAIDKAGPEAVAEMLVVKITGAAWSDGTIPLQDALRAAVVARLPDLLVEALESLRAKSVEAARALRATFDLDGNEDIGQHGPGEHASHEFKIDAASSPENAGFVLVLDRAIFAGLTAQARELLAYLHANGPSPLAASPQRAELKQAGFIQGTNLPNTKWRLTEQGELAAAQVVAPAPAAA